MDSDHYDSWSFAVGFATGIVLSGIALMIGLGIALMIGFWFV